MWEICAYQNADSLFGIFNAAAAIHGSGDYMAAVAAVAFLGSVTSTVGHALTGLLGTAFQVIPGVGARGSPGPREGRGSRWTSSSVSGSAPPSRASGSRRAASRTSKSSSER